MKLLSLLLIAALLAACSGTKEVQHGNEQTSDTKSLASAIEVKPTTAAALQISSTEKTPTANDMKPEPLPIVEPVITHHRLQAQESRALDVTGFITENGNIYEIGSKNVAGNIQSRQALDAEQNICNYGSVVIYSDLPCDQATNMRVTEIEDKPATSQIPATMVEEEHKLIKPNKKPTNNNKANRPNKNGQKRPNQNGNKRPNQNGNKRPNQNGNKRPIQNGNNRPNQNGNKRPIQNGNNRPNQNGNKRPNQNGNNRPNQNGNKRPNQNGNKRPNQNGNKRPNQNVNKRPNQNTNKRPNQNGQNRPIQNINQLNKRGFEEEYDVNEVVNYFQNQHGRTSPLQYTFSYDDDV